VAPSARSRARRAAVAAAKTIIVALLVLALGVTHELRAAQHAADDGERALLEMDASLRAGAPAAAGSRARVAGEDFARAGVHVATVRSLFGPVAGIAPIDDQLRAIGALAGIGEDLALAAERAADDTAALTGRDGRVTAPLARLDRAKAAVTRVGRAVDAAIARVDAVRTLGIVGPVADAATRARRRLTRTRAQVAAGANALGALAALAGDGQPKRFLLLSQNPAELRPTGGFIGTYGLLELRDGRLRLSRYRSIESWYFRHRRAVVSPSRAAHALRLPREPVPQTLANANAAGDWPTSARLAARLWRRGGEKPVDGVISFTPELVARALTVLGPQRIHGYPGAVTSRNVIALLDHNTHTGARARRIDRAPFASLAAASARKRFVGLLAARLLRVVQAHPARALGLAREIGRGLAAREGMAWSPDRRLARVLRERGWDGRIPPARGDFFYDGEFQYAVKNGRGLRRRFHHVVALRADGSARVTTTIRVANTQSDGMDSFAYMTIYGPAQGVLQPESDPADATERQLGGHPAYGWLRNAPKWGATRLRVVWEVPRMLERRGDARLVYRLLWMRIPAHRRDVLSLRVIPPRGWRWAGSPPPPRVRLTKDVRGAWSLVSGP
jgi:hypothetical protein